MSNINKQMALLELGNRSLDAQAKAFKELSGITLGAVLCSIRVGYELEARAIINHRGIPKAKKLLLSSRK